MKISIKSIPHHTQRYDTVGDYLENNEKNIYVRVSSMTDIKYEYAVAIHELIEAVLTKCGGINWKDIDDFDRKYEEKRKKGDTSEPGDNPNAPYYKQHQLATLIERIICSEIGVDWEKYGEEVESL